MKNIRLRVVNAAVDAYISGMAADKGSLFADNLETIRWHHNENDTAGRFEATFKDAATNTPTWPFDTTESVLVITRNASPVDRKLKSGAPPYIKYTVRFVPDNVADGPVAAHDPMIIIRGGKNFMPIITHSLAAAGGVLVTLVAVTTFLRPMLCGVH
jgi:hypothetical protein